CRWLGAFQRETADVRERDGLGFLKSYDRTYYEGWIRRTLDYSRPVAHRHPWLVPVCTGFAELLDELIESQPAVGHGEFTGRNGLLRGGTIYPVDWESAAKAPGEVDLAAFCDGWWEPEFVKAGELEYARCRWPDGASPRFRRRLALAKAYVQL